MTILFQSDWTDAQGNLRAVPHIETKNTSFLRTCMVLKKMGIKNYAFPLALYDKDLKDIDVYALEDNTPENELLRIKVQIEARRNVWYYLRECLRIYEQGGDPVPFRLNRSSVAMTWCFMNGIDYACYQCRQSGKTVSALGLTSWIIYISGEEYQFGMLAKDNSLREENVKRVRSFGENLPDWWIADDKNRDKKNTSEIYYHALRTHYVTYVAQSDARKADLQARGASPPAFHFDEFDYNANIEVSYPTIIASTSTARENAKKNGKPYSNIITSTAGDPKKPECREAAKILDGAMPFTEQLYDIENNDKLHDIVKATSPQKMIIGTFSHLQLGYDNDWLRDKILRGRLTKEQVMRDYLNRRVSISEDPIIPKGTLEAITRSQMEPKYTEILTDRFLIYWYLDKETVKSREFKERPIIVGCDSSEMIGRDATTLIGIDPRDLSTVFTLRCAEGNISKLGVVIANLLLSYPAMVWVPENKSSGTSLIDIVTMILKREHHNPFKRIFNWVVNNKDEPEFSKYDWRDTNLLDSPAKRFFGIKTDKTKRDQLYSTTLLDGAARAATVVRDQTLINELSSLTNKNGRVDHADGCHDDSVVGWLMALWVIFNGKHLDVYGIKPGVILSRINPGKPDKNQLALAHFQMIREKIDQLEKMYRQQTDPTLAKLIKVDIDVYKTMIENAPIDTPETVDDVNRNPKRFTDAIASENSREKSTDSLERSLRIAMGMFD